MPVNNQNPQQQKRVPVSINGYPEAVHDMMRAKYPDYDQVMGLGNQTMQGAPSGQAPAVAPQPMNMNVFQQNGGVSGKLEAPAVQPQPTQQTQPAASSVQTPYLGDAADNTPHPQTSFEGMQQPPTGWKADGTPSYDALSSALSGYQAAQSKQVPEFQADPSKRDGGFFGWLDKLIPKNRPGMREGETPEEYDRRITTNRERIAAFADAIRHMGNIVNTSKGAPLQVFNDPTTMMEQGYQNRKAQRQKQAAIDADAAYKQANLDLKSAAARAQEVYRKFLLEQKNDDLKWRKEKDQRDFTYNAGQDEIENRIKLWDRELKDKGFDEKKRHNLITEAITRFRANKIGSGGGRSGRGGGSSSAKYTTWDAEGKPHYASNKTMYEANEAYYNGNTSGSSSTSSSKEVFNRDGSTTRTTNRQGGSSVAQRAGAQRRQREEARKKAAKPAGKSKNGYKNTKKLGL